MISDTMHPEDIKATLRKRFGSVFAFEQAVDLPHKSVSDFLRGRANQRVKAAINKVLTSSPSETSDNSSTAGAAHRQNGTVK